MRILKIKYTTFRGDTMKLKPTVAIVGRPNVGKSTLFNRLVGKRVSIVKDEPNVTRDRVIMDAEWLNYKFTLVDTGGLELKSQDEMHKHIVYQAKLAIDVADVIVFMVDGKQGLLQGDYDVAEILRKSKKPVVLVVNKVDNNKCDNLYDFYALGLGDPIAISSEQGKGLGDMLDEIVKDFQTVEDIEEENQPLKIAIVGRPNVGKSSLTNRLLGSDRMVVADKAGTTRDSIDSLFRYNGEDYILIDTAGIRRKNAIEMDSVEYYSVIRSLEAIKRADVCIIVLDASEEVTEQDVKIAGLVHEQGKPSVVVYNKWDKIEKDEATSRHYKKKLDEDLKFMSYYVPLYVSTLTGQRLSSIMPTVLKVYENASKRLQTSTLNQILMDAVTITPPPSQNGKRLKIKYMTQASTNPPTFILFVNDSTLLHYSYERYLENQIRNAVDFSGTPIVLVARDKGAKEE